MSQIICYCFGYSEADIRCDVEKNRGESLILEQVIAAKRGGGCDCSSRHPEKR
jgi:hypothetical protein